MQRVCYASAEVMLPVTSNFSTANSSGMILSNHSQIVYSQPLFSNVIREAQTQENKNMKYINKQQEEKEIQNKKVKN